MTKIIQYLIIVLLVFATTIINAQDYQGKAYYQTKRNFSVKLDSTQIPDAQQEAIQAMLKKQFEKTYVLSFNKESSIYKEEKSLDTPKPEQSGFSIVIAGNDNTLFKNTKEKTYVDAQESFGKRFLIKDEIKDIDWKLEKDTKKIGNYLCFKATSSRMVPDYDEFGKKKEKERELIITAWYTPEIPINNGPVMYQGLPGLILELHEDKMHYVCNKIVLNSKEKIEIVAPDKGKEVTQEEFNAIMEKKQKEMMDNFKGGRKKGDGNSFSITIGG